MIRRNDFILELVTHVQQRRVLVDVTVTNNSPSRYIINTLAIWKGGLHSELPFKISGPGYVSCSPGGAFYARIQHGIEVDSMRSVTNTIDLTTYCHFMEARPGTYLLEGWSNTFLYRSFDDLNPADDHPTYPDEAVSLHANATFTLFDEEDRVQADPVGRGSTSNNEL